MNRTARLTVLCRKKQKIRSGSKRVNNADDQMHSINQYLRRQEVSRGKFLKLVVHEADLN